MVEPPSLRTRKFCEVLSYGVLFVAIAVVTYLGLRPSVTTAESVATTESVTATSEGSHSVPLEIPEIGIQTEVVEVEAKDHKLEAPEKIVGTYRQVENKELLIAHSTTAFKNLKKITIGAEIHYRGTVYKVTDITSLTKDEVDMKEVLKSADEPTLILMTCYGEHLEGNDFSHRLLVTAKR